MRNFYIYSVSSGICIAFTKMRGENRFDIYDIKTGEYISFANICGDIFNVYDARTGRCVENGRRDRNSNMVRFYDRETGSYDKFGRL